MWVYIQSEFGEHHLFTVGFYDPNGKWRPDSDHNNREEAAARVHFLNGGGVKRKNQALEDIVQGLYHCRHTSDVERVRMIAQAALNE